MLKPSRTYHIGEECHRKDRVILVKKLLSYNNVPPEHARILTTLDQVKVGDYVIRCSDEPIAVYHMIMNSTGKKILKKIPIQ